MSLRFWKPIEFLCCFAFCCHGFVCGRAPAQDYQFYADATTAPLQTQPMMMSRFPNTISAALSNSRSELRTVDVNGDVWQWKLHPPPAPEKIASTASEPACASLSCDGHLLAWADFDCSVAVMEVDSARTILNVQEDTDTVAIRFSRDGSKLATATRDGVIRVRELTSGSEQRFEVDPGAVQSLAFTNDGRTLAVSSLTSRVHLFDLQKPDTAARILDVGGSPVTAHAFTPDGGHLVVASADGTANVFSVTHLSKVAALESYPFAIWTLAFDDSGERLVGGSWDGTTRVWSTNSWRQIQRTKGHEESVISIMISPEGMLSAGMDGRLLFWPPVSQGVPSQGIIQGGATHQLWVSRFSPNGKKLFFGGGGEQFEIWDFESRTRELSLTGHPVTRCAAFSPDGSVVATGGDDKLIWITAVDSGAKLHQLEGHQGAISMLAFIDEGKTLISGCDRGTIKFWDATTGRQTGESNGHRQQLYCGAVSPDGKWLVTGGGDWLASDPGELIVWDLDTRKRVADLDGHRQTVWSIVVTADSRHFAASDAAGDVKIWDIETARSIRTLSHDTWLRPLAISPDGKTLAVGRGDGPIELWDTKDWTRKGTCVGHRKFAFSLDFSPDGTTLVSASDDGTVRFWKAP